MAFALLMLLVRTEDQLTMMSSSGFFTGRLSRSTASTTVKIAVFAPMPRASERIATAVNPGLLARMRAP